MTCPFAYNPDLKEEEFPHNEENVLDYDSYLKLDRILTSNDRQSKKGGKEAHTEHLFITIHQSFELWFKQMIHEIRAVVRIFQKESVKDEKLLFIHNCLNRCSSILISLSSQFATLESMSAMEFLEFRAFLGKASGFQSWQFRVFENLLGLRPEWRNRYGKRDYKEFLKPLHREIVAAAEEEDDLFTLFCEWLSRCPFIIGENVVGSFWSEFREGVRRMLDEEIEKITQEPYLNEKDKEEAIEEARASAAGWRVIFDEEYFNELKRKNRVKWTYSAFQGAIFINHYRNHPSLQMPHKLLVDLLDIETALRTFRMRHADMVHRIIGNKIGTGGSSGYHYLRTSATKHQVFSDFFNMNSYVVPEEYLPQKDIERYLNSEILEEVCI